MPAKLAVVEEGLAGKGSGAWDGSGFQWVAGDEDSMYSVVVASEEMGVYGRFTLSSVSYFILYVFVLDRKWTHEQLMEIFEATNTSFTMWYSEKHIDIRNCAEHWLGESRSGCFSQCGYEYPGIYIEFPGTRVP